MRLAERAQALVVAAIALQWLTTLVVALRSDSVDLGAGMLINVLLLGPLTIVCAFLLSATVGGIALGAWTMLVWVAMPWLAPAFTLTKYDGTLRDDVLPLALGLTGDAGYAEGAAILVALTLLSRRTRPTTILGALVLIVLGAVWLRRAPGVEGLSLDAFQANMAGLREYFFSQRVLQWLPLAGIVAVARRSPALAALLGVWLGAFVALRLTSSAASFENGEFFRLLLPALPAYVLLAASLPLLIPTLATRLGPLARPMGPLGPRLALGPDTLLEQGQPLRQDHVLIGQLGDHGRVVEQHREDEERRDGEEHGGRVAGDADPAGDRVQAAAPGREDEQDDAGHEPEQRVTLT